MIIACGPVVLRPLGRHLVYFVLLQKLQQRQLQLRSVVAVWEPCIVRHRLHFVRQTVERCRTINNMKHLSRRYSRPLCFMYFLCAYLRLSIRVHFAAALECSFPWRLRSALACSDVLFYIPTSYRTEYASYEPYMHDS